MFATILSSLKIPTLSTKINWPQEQLLQVSAARTVLAADNSGWLILCYLGYVIFLGIETSCDETAAAVVRGGTTLLSNVIVSQIDIHREFGGVVPEVAARSHIEVILPTVEKAIQDANITWSEIDGIAVTNGPGLSGSLLIGVLAARTLSLLKGKPLYAVNHVEGHTYANFITEVGPGFTFGPLIDRSISKLLSKKPEFPLLSLTVSGGHSQLVLFKKHGDYRLLGQTRDDAVGEAFDKVAKLLGLGYPGGPEIAKAAEYGDSHAYKFPRAKLSNPYDFSFSGLKTAVLRHLQQLIREDFNFPSFAIAGHLTRKQVNDTAASFQRVAVETLVDKTVAAYDEFIPKTVVIAGGVAANLELRHQLAAKLPVQIEYAPAILCTDNAAMIASLGCYVSRFSKPDNPFKLEIVPSLSM